MITEGQRWKDREEEGRREPGAGEWEIEAGGGRRGGFNSALYISFKPVSTHSTHVKTHAHSGHRMELKYFHTGILLSHLFIYECIIWQLTTEIIAIVCVCWKWLCNINITHLFKCHCVNMYNCLSINGLTLIFETCFMDIHIWHCSDEGEHFRTTEWIFSFHIPEVRPSQMTGKFTLLWGYSVATEDFWVPSELSSLRHLCTSAKTPKWIKANRKKNDDNTLTDEWKKVWPQFQEDYKTFQVDSLDLPFFYHSSHIPFFFNSLSSFIFN